jgi:glycosyltransferase involved in cell wall biosynthesis
MMRLVADGLVADLALALRKCQEVVLNHAWVYLARRDAPGDWDYLRIHVYRVVADRRGAFVQPALFEAFGLTILEAMASGLPSLPATVVRRRSSTTASRVS